MMTTSTAKPIIAVPMEKSFSVRIGSALASLLPRIFLKPDVSAPMIVGMVLSRAITPAAATAPAPIGRM